MFSIPAENVQSQNVGPTNNLAVNSWLRFELLWCCWLGLLTCKNRGHITYIVLVQTLNHAQSINQSRTKTLYVRLSAIMPLPMTIPNLNQPGNHIVYGQDGTDECIYAVSNYHHYRYIRHTRTQTQTEMITIRHVTHVTTWTNIFL